MEEESLDIQTPENVTFGYQVAGIGSRFLATLIDTLIVILLQVVVIVSFILILNALNLPLFGSEISAWVYAVLGMIAFIFYWGYYI
ncbi:MAG: RDD family protein, partial [Anaerolineae bacterium]|nr:RDD family protein [Anaerolineae bacterium]